MIGCFAHFLPFFIKDWLKQFKIQYKSIQHIDKEFQKYEMIKKKIVEVGYQSYQQCKISETVSNITKIPNPQFKAKPTSCTSVLTYYLS